MQNYDFFFEYKYFFCIFALSKQKYMKNNNSIKKSKTEYLLTQIGFVVVSVAILVFFLPQESSSTLEFDLGKPWKHNSLIANFDFPILKSKIDIEKERDSLMRNFAPYYHLDKKVAEQQIRKFHQVLSDSFPSMREDDIQHLVGQLNATYERGIIEPFRTVRNYSELFGTVDSNSNVRIIEDNQSRTVRLADIYSPVAAYEHILTSNPDDRDLLKRCNISEYIETNLFIDSMKTAMSKEEMLNSLPLANGAVISGQKIIDKGEIVDEKTFNILLSYEKEINKRKYNSGLSYGIKIGQVLFVAILIVMFTIFLAQYRRDYFDKFRNTLMIYTLIVFFPILCFLMVQHQLFHVYVIPFVIAPIFIRVFQDSRTAFIAHLVVVLLCACSLHFPYEFIIVQTIAGFSAISSLKNLSNRSQIIRTAFIVTICSAATFYALELVQNGNFTHFDRRMYQYFAINGIFLLFAYPMMWGIEKAFGFTSDVTLIELSNTNNALLRKLSETTPGTFQHSIQVGNLAAEVADKIGANRQLVRTGALYHDIGKMSNPAFFTENQSGFNPHEKLSSVESAQIVISHVSDGLKLAEKYAVPQIIKDFIITHHGQGQCRFFLNKYIEEHPDEQIDVLMFTYPGKNPFTREQAILMMTDTVEAASRSLSDYTETSISELVDRLIDQQLEAGYFQDCPITFRDIAIAKMVLTDKLKSINHTRIKYPTFSRNQD